jgi:flagellar motor protein MotB
MPRRSLHLQKQQPLDIYQSFTDLMSNAFMILSLLLLLVFLALIQALQSNKKLQAANKRLQSALPIIIDERSGKFQFRSGSAELNTELKQYIKSEITPAIQTIIKDREIAFIQVIGHTDGQGINNNSNLDKTLEEVAHNQKYVSKLIPGSNADLGLMRALAVVQELQKTGRLNKIQFRAYSAAQLYLPSGQLASINRNADDNRRRIEIRFIPPGQSK